MISCAQAPSIGRGWFWIFPAVAMSLGWGLRGYIGGGPIGAMIPGAMVALTLCILLGRWRHCAVPIAVGAIGVGLGGNMTYGQTIGFVLKPDTMAWGLLGLTLKGAIWGLTGGLLIGMGLLAERFRRREWLAGLLILNLGAWAGWYVINRPKLLYFSDPLNKPREEVWAGLLVGALGLLGYVIFLKRTHLPVRFALWGAAAGGLGFGGGGLFFVLQTLLPPEHRNWPFWKAMEFTFGFLFGLGMGLATERSQSELSSPLEQRSDPLAISTSAIRLYLGALVAFGAIWLNALVPFKASLTVAGAFLILLALGSELLAWHVALSTTAYGFIRDYYLAIENSIPAEHLGVAWAGVVAVTAGVIGVVDGRVRRRALAAPFALHFLTGLACCFAFAKMAHEKVHGRNLLVLAGFTIGWVAVTALLNRIVRHRGGADSGGYQV